MSGAYFARTAPWRFVSLENPAVTADASLSPATFREQVNQRRRQDARDALRGKVREFRRQDLRDHVAGAAARTAAR